MKKLTTIIGLLCAVTTYSFAQSHVDALRYSQHNIGGTARSVAMGGAFGALGGDFSTLSGNPAGLAVYRKSEFTFTPEFYNINTNTRYYGNEKKEGKFNVNLSNLGYVGVFNDQSGSLTSINFGVGFNRIANFHRNSIVQGDNPYTTYADYMAADATEFGFDDFAFYSSALFFDGGLIVESNSVDSTQAPGTYWITDDYLANDGSLRPTEQRIINSERGRINEWAFSLGFNFSDILYLGGTFGIQPLYYESEKNFQEFDATDRAYNYFDYYQNLVAQGTGYTAKFGVIVRPIPILRVGAAIHAPVTYLIREEYNTNLNSQYVSGTIYPADNDGYSLDELKSEYKVVTPLKAMGSIGVTLGKMLILSGDLEYIDYSTMRMKGSGINLSDQNESIAIVYSNTLNLKLGGELRLGAAYFRGGLGMFGSPYAKLEENADSYRLSGSGGFGVRNEGMFIDIACQFTSFDERSFLYSAEDGTNQWRDNPANFESKAARFMVTLGFKF